MITLAFDGPEKPESAFLREKDPLTKRECRESFLSNGRIAGTARLLRWIEHQWRVSFLTL